jgi:hypothetical protein
MRTSASLNILDNLVEKLLILITYSINLTTNLAVDLKPCLEILLRLSSVTPREIMHPNKDSIVDVTSLIPYVIYILELIIVIIVLKL